MDRRIASVLAVSALLAVAGCSGFVGLDGGDPAGTTGTTTDGADGEWERACVTFRDGETGAVDGRAETVVADTHNERYQGLSNTAELPNDTGMLFVFDSATERTFVMREMNYPIDMVFVDADGRVTAVFHAEVEHDDSLHPYTARAKWVVELPYEWAARHGVTAGDRLDVEYGCGNASLGTRTT